MLSYSYDVAAGSKRPADGVEPTPIADSPPLDAPSPPRNSKHPHTSSDAGSPAPIAVPPAATPPLAEDNGMHPLQTGPTSPELDHVSGDALGPADSSGIGIKEDG